MGIQVSWDSGAVCLTYSGRWTWEEHHAAIQAAGVLAEARGGCVDAIVDVSGAELAPPNAIRQIGRTLMTKHPYWTKRAIIIPHGMVTEFMLEMIIRTYAYAVHDHDFRFVRSLAEARDLLAAEHTPG